MNKVGLGRSRVSRARRGHGGGDQRYPRPDRELSALDSRSRDMRDSKVQSLLAVSVYIVLD